MPGKERDNVKGTFLRMLSARCTRKSGASRDGSAPHDPCDNGTPDSTDLIKLDNVSMIYNTPAGEVSALSDISFNVGKNEFISIVGSSGCGKSTVLSIISGLLKPTGGSVLYKGRPVTGVSGEIGYMLQHDHLFPWSTVYENVRLGLKIHKKDTQENRERVMRLLRDYNLAEFKDSYPRELSGGMRQRAALIRTLALDPEVLLLDEPFSALDYQTRIRVSDDISGIIRSRGKTAVLVTHDISEAISLSDRVVILSRRPATVKRIIDIDLGDNADVPAKRKSPHFSGYFDTIWEELNNE